jgi:hypothetical protein
VESGNKKLSVSVDNRVSKVEILSTGGISPLPSEVESLILVHPCKREPDNRRSKRDIENKFLERISNGYSDLLGCKVGVEL